MIVKTYTNGCYNAELVQTNVYSLWFYPLDLAELEKHGFMNHLFQNYSK
jgi:hypothetical protein